MTNHLSINTLTDSLPRYAIIVAGGSGSRMKTSVSKQFLLLQGKPILQRTIERFLAITPTPHIILVLPERDLTVWQDLCRQHQFFPDAVDQANTTIQTVLGGATRFQSVRNGLAAIQATDGLIAVHDGVRPFVSPAIIEESYRTAEQTGSAVTCVAVKDSVRVVDAAGQSQAVDRSQYRLIQTPQTFRLNLFKHAFQTEEQPFFTDCASVVEYAGQVITLIDGAYDNIKITTPEDLAWGQQVNFREE